VYASLSLKPALDAIGTAIDQRFDRLLPVPSDPRRRLVEAMRYAAMGGGKRMRPLLVVASCDLFHVDKERALRAAIATECVHVYSLVHDDLPCMDDDDTRRGKPTLHKAFDEAAAVLAGDALQALAFEVLADEATHEDPYVRSELVLELARASGTGGMAGGQMMDLVAEDETFDLPTTTRLQQLKTGALIGFSVEAGAIMGKASADNRVKLRGYARDLGLAFQIADDLLDVEASAETAGKATGKDAARGKATLVGLHGADAMRARLAAIVDDAVDRLGPFGDRAAVLVEAARFIAFRDR
jgi:farnesyl diphosphate synthase